MKHTSRIDSMLNQRVYSQLRANLIGPINYAFSVTERIAVQICRPFMNQVRTPIHDHIKNQLRYTL